MAHTNPLPTRVAGELRAEMARQKKTITQMAEALGLNRQAAKRRYEGDLVYTLDEVETLAIWLDVDIEALLVGRVAAVA